MSGEPKMFRINPENRESEAITEVEFAQLGFRERQHIQEWVATNPHILGDNLLIVGKEFSDFDRTNERLDLLAVDRDGKLVIIELKRDDSGSDSHWQAIKYASYLSHATASDIVRILADYVAISESEAAEQLLHHLNADDLNSLNHDQRIILASHRFAPEVTSAVLWLNEKSVDENRISCVQLVPYHDKQTNSLYVQASTIIPVPGGDEFVIRVSNANQGGTPASSSSFAANLKKAYDRNRDDAVTHFLRKVGTVVTNSLPVEIRPDKKSKWAGRHGDQIGRYYHLWYSSPVWSNWGTSYRINMYPQEGAGEWRACVGFRHDQDTFAGRLYDVDLPDECETDDWNVWVDVGIGILDKRFGDKIASSMQQLIETITPLVKRSEDGDNEEEV